MASVFDTISNALSRITPIKPIGSSSAFTNNITSKAQASTDAGTKARNAVYSPEAQRQASAQTVSNYKTNIKSIGDWSKGITDQVRASSYAKRAAEQAKFNAQQQTSSRQESGGVTVGKAGTVQPITYNVGPTTDARAQLVKQAQSMLGTPYAWGGGGYGNRSSRGTGKGTQNVVGVDCSGLTSYVYGTLGIKLPRQSDAQLRTAGYKTNVNNLQPGDLVGWGRGGHVALYIGNGMIIESPRPGLAVRTRALNKADYSGGVYGVHLNLTGDK